MALEQHQVVFGEVPADLSCISESHRESLYGVNNTQQSRYFFFERDDINP